VCVVNRLEVIYVEQQNTNCTFRTGCSLKLAVQRLHDCTPIPRTGKWIMGCLKTKLFVSLDLIVLQRQDSVASPQPGLQFAFIEGLGQIIVSPGLQSPDQIPFRIFGCR
jgi:hypothetical protein